MESVLLRAKLIGGIPSELVGALTGLVQGHFPVAAPAKYADSSVVKLAKKKVKTSNAAIAIDSNPSAKGTSINLAAGTIGGVDKMINGADTDGDTVPDGSGGRQ